MNTKRVLCPQYWPQTSAFCLCHFLPFNKSSLWEYQESFLAVTDLNSVHDSSTLPEAFGSLGRRCNRSRGSMLSPLSDLPGPSHQGNSSKILNQNKVDKRFRNSVYHPVLKQEGKWWMLNWPSMTYGINRIFEECVLWIRYALKTCD